MTSSGRAAAITVVSPANAGAFTSGSLVSTAITIAERRATLAASAAVALSQDGSGAKIKSDPQLAPSPLGFFILGLPRSARVVSERLQAGRVRGAKGRAGKRREGEQREKTWEDRNPEGREVQAGLLVPGVVHLLCCFGSCPLGTAQPRVDVK